MPELDTQRMVMNSETDLDSVCSESLISSFTREEDQPNNDRNGQ